MLYQPFPTSSGPLDLDLLLGLSHRYYVVEHVARFLARFHLVHAVHAHSVAPPSFFFDRPEYVAIINGMVRNMKPYLLMLYHFIEMYREGLAEISFTDEVSIEEQRNRVEARIIRQYNCHVIHRLCAMSDFLLKVTVRRLRSASNAGRLERLLRGWSRDSASEAQCMELLVIGTLEAVNKSVALSGYPERIAAIERHLQDLSIMKKPDRRVSRNISVISRKAKPSISDTSSTPFRPLMQPLDQETVGRISKLLPDRDDFLNIKRLASLFEPGVVSADQIETPWNFIARIIDKDDDFDFVAGASQPSLSIAVVDKVRVPEWTATCIIDGTLEYNIGWQLSSESHHDGSDYASSQEE